MRNESVDLWSIDEVHFQQHGSRCRMWIPPEIKDPVLLHAPTRKSVGYFGAVRLRDGRFVFRRETGKFNGPSFLQFLQQLCSASRGTRRRGSSSPTMPLITTPACTDHGGKSTPPALPWISFPLTVPNSIRSSERGSLPAVVACIIAISTNSKTSSARLKPNSQIGPPATMSSVGYAPLLKTLCLAIASSGTPAKFKERQSRVLSAFIGVPCSSALCRGRCAYEHFRASGFRFTLAALAPDRVMLSRSTFT